MCGICGYISSVSYNDDEMVKSLNHRGPDAQGKFKISINDVNVFLGHTRLSIIDLSDSGRQPMFTPDEKIAIIFNGEIYNFQTLRDKFLPGQKLKSKTDTEVILHLYQKLGVDFAKELNGDFAIAILDLNISKLFLLRDRTGIKPLYYSFDNGELIFASEIIAIRKSGKKLLLDENNLQKYFVFKYSPLQETLFKDIKRLPPAGVLEYDLQSKLVKLFSYWHFEKNKEYAKLSYEDARERVKELVEQSVLSQLMSDVPLGTFFSGGIDSSIIAYCIKEHHQIKHYSARKSEKDLKAEGSSSDFYYAQKVAQLWNLNLEPIDIGSDEANIDLIRRTLFYSDDLIADGSMIPSYLITKDACKTSKVILSGMGADELFMGYAGHQISQLAMQLDSMPDFLSKGINKFFASLDQGRGAFKPYRRFLNKLGKYHSYVNLRYGFFNIVGDYHNSLSVCKGDEETTLKIFEKYFNADNENVFESIDRFNYENFLVKNLHYLDRMSMANSVESRAPFLDNDIIEFALSIPSSFKLSPFGLTKKILKEAFTKELPSYVLNRRKAGFGMPLRSIFSDPQKVYTLLDRNFLGSFNFFSLENIERLVNNHAKGKEDNSAIIYSLICFQEWHKLYL